MVYEVLNLAYEVSTQINSYIAGTSKREHVKRLSPCKGIEQRLHTDTTRHIEKLYLFLKIKVCQIHIRKATTKDGFQRRV